MEVFMTGPSAEFVERLKLELIRRGAAARTVVRAGRVRLAIYVSTGWRGAIRLDVYALEHSALVSRRPGEGPPGGGWLLDIRTPASVAAKALLRIADGEARAALHELPPGIRPLTAPALPLGVGSE
jgi:hypothetical protein